jgi:hypothetical protein
MMDDQSRSTAPEDSKERVVLGMADNPDERRCRC